MWCGQVCPRSRCRFGRGEPSPGADVAGAVTSGQSMWQHSLRPVVRSASFFHPPTIDTPIETYDTALAPPPAVHRRAARRPPPRSRLDQLRHEVCAQRSGSLLTRRPVLLAPVPVQMWQG